MYFILILFFVSLVGIIFMIGRKLSTLQSGQLSQGQESVSEAEYLEEWKHLALRSIKRHGYTALVVTIRFYVQSSNFLKSKRQEIKVWMKDMRGKKANGSSEERQAVNNFLKMISEYKHKIREIKHKIKEEENL